MTPNQISGHFLDCHVMIRMVGHQYSQLQTNCQHCHVIAIKNICFYSDICLFCGVDDSETVLRAWATNLEDFDTLELAKGDLRTRCSLSPGITRSSL